MFSHTKMPDLVYYYKPMHQQLLIILLGGDKFQILSQQVETRGNGLGWYASYTWSGLGKLSSGSLAESLESAQSWIQLGEGEW